VENAPTGKVLLIGNNPDAWNLVRDALTASNSGSFEVECVQLLSEGLERVGKRGIAAILLDLALPDSHGMETFDKLFSAAADIPILILADGINESLAMEAVGRGAQDYLLPSHLDSYSLSRALRNSIDRKSIEDALYVERERALVTLNSIGDAVLCTDISGRITYLNAVAETLTGWSREEATGRLLAEVFRIIDSDTGNTAKDPLKIAIVENRTVGLTENCILTQRDGSQTAIEDSAAPIHDRAGRIIGAVIVFRDVTAARSVSSQIAYRAQHDVLTDLPNRQLLNDRISQAISMAQRENRSLAVMFLDLDHFKHVNDSLGHAIGDLLLQSVSKRLVAAVRHSDTVSRQGGDEFVVLLAETTHPEDAATSAEKVLRALSAPHSIGEHELHISCSIGISIFQGDGESAETLIQNADLAMYHAKEEGRNRYMFFKPEMNMKAAERQHIEHGLRSALELREFELAYQPKVNLKTSEIDGVEALIRWRHPERGLILPVQFISVAEDCGLIVPIGRWVLGEACRQARAWQDAGLPALTISVNVSAAEFRDKGFIEGVARALSETGIEAGHLELELTERVMMRDVGRAADAFKELKSMGIRLAVDDFGTGYSSLSYLRQFPIDVLKIDRSFVRQIADGNKGSPIVNAIIAMGENLNYIVVAEGVETDEQKLYLQAHGCAMGQGFLFGRPVPAAQFAQWLKAGKYTENGALRVDCPI